MVAADHPAASVVGAQILADGGNAVDAAVATSFALAVTRPYSTGLGGGGFMMIRMKGKAPKILDYRETAPASCTPKAYLDRNGVADRSKIRRGHWSVGVPGHLRGMTMALEEYGTISLAEALEPAIALAEDGFDVDQHTHAAMAGLAAKLREDPKKAAAYREAGRVFLKRGEPYAIGERLRQPDLARTLRILAREGAESFYTGTIARAVVTEMTAAGGPVTMADLAAYKVVVRRPLVGQFRGHTVLAMPPPSSGGACMLMMMNVMNTYDPKVLTPAEYWQALVEAMKHAYADRAASLGDADRDSRIGTDVRRMISPDYAVALRDTIDLTKTRTDPAAYGRYYMDDRGGTSHYCVIDADGNAVAATETVNWRFGSYIVVPGTGIVLNNELDDFAIQAGKANEQGLMKSTRNIIGPGRRPLSSMSPTMILSGDDVIIVAGASGGQRIITATLQSILRIIDFDAKPGAAVAAPRLHHQWSPNVLHVEDGFPDDVRKALTQCGHEIKNTESVSAGVCQLIHLSRGKITGVSDYRKGGQPAGR